MVPKGVKLCIKADVQVLQETSCHPDHLPLGRSINQTRPHLQSYKVKVAESFIVCYGRRRGNNAEHEIQ